MDILRAAAPPKGWSGLMSSLAPWVLPYPNNKIIYNSLNFCKTPKNSGLLAVFGAGGFGNVGSSSDDHKPVKASTQPISSRVVAEIIGDGGV